MEDSLKSCARYLLSTLASSAMLGVSVFFGVGSSWACPNIDGLVDTNCDRRLVIVAFGDSITAGRRDTEGRGYPGRLNTIFPHAEMVNLGISGEYTYQGRRRAPGAFAARREVDYAIILEGVNDYYKSDHSAKITRDNLLQIRYSARNVGAEALIGKLTQTSRGFQRPWVSAVNKELTPYSKIDFYSLGTSILSWDQLHPDDEGYQEMAEIASLSLLRASTAIRPLDSDLDGVYDYEEAWHLTNPHNRDSDGDGISDGDELYLYGSNPLSLDSDADGISDTQEVALGSNPADAHPGAPVLNSLTAIP